MNPTHWRLHPRYRLRTLLIATTLWCLLIGLFPSATGIGLLALLLLALCPVAVLCLLILINPFENRFRLRFGLRTVFFVTTVLCIFLALLSFEGGRLFLGLSLLFVGPIGLLYALVVVFSWLFGTPGERQRRKLEPEFFKGDAKSK